MCSCSPLSSGSIRSCSVLICVKYCITLKDNMHDMSYSLLHLQILICFQGGDSFTCISPEEMGKQGLPITSSILNLKYLFKMHNMLVSQLPWRALYLSTDYVNALMILSCPLHLHFALLCQFSYTPLLSALSGLKNTVTLIYVIVSTQFSKWSIINFFPSTFLFFLPV